jgi:hypothetical protein
VFVCLKEPSQRTPQRPRTAQILPSVLF